MTDLSDEEVDQICAGLIQNAAKVRYLQRIGLTVRVKPNGKPLVNRMHYDAAMNPIDCSYHAQQRSNRGPTWRVAT